MPATPERSRATTKTEAIELATNPATPEIGGAVYDGASFAMRDALGVFNPRTGGSGGNATIVYWQDDPAVFSTSSAEYVDARTFAFSVPDGDYLAAVYAEIRATNVVSRAVFEASIGGSLSDDAGASGFADVGQILWASTVAIDRVTVAGGSTSIILRIKRGGNVGSAELRRARALLIPGAFL